MESPFQWSNLASRLPNVVGALFSAWLSGDFNLSGYGDWYALHRPSTVNITSISLPLTTQQLAYLQTWQRSLYPLEVDLSFIESLKQQLMLLEY